LKPRTVLLLAVALAVLAGCVRKNLATPELYSTYCARCHGDRGKGKGDSEAFTLYPHLNLLTSPMVRGGDRAAVRRRIREGYGPMPGFARRLTPQEVERLVDFTFQLEPTPKERP
jgi:mono/diheme cytochrome c family protein